MTPEPARSNAHKLFSRIAREAGVAILTSSVPIYRDVENEPGLDFDRTGLLFRIGAEHFILTASHGVKQFLKDKTMLYADVSQRMSAPIPLVDSKFYGTEVDDHFPDRDIVAIHLDYDAVQQFYPIPHRRFLTLAECDQLLDPRPALYMVAGFPWDLYQMKPVAHGPAMFFFGSTQPDPRTENFDPRLHFALSVDEHGEYGLRGTETNFVREEIPPFFGMSGCGIWRVASSTMRDPDCWDASMVRLVAIQNRIQDAGRRGRYTIGTWVRYVVDRIVDELPNLRPATLIAYKPGY